MTETSPRQDRDKTETWPRHDRDMTETSPRQDRDIDRDMTETSPRQDRDMTETWPRQDRDILSEIFSGAWAAPGRLIHVRPQAYRYWGINTVRKRPASVGYTSIFPAIHEKKKHRTDRWSKKLRHLADFSFSNSSKCFMTAVFLRWQKQTQHHWKKTKKNTDIMNMSSFFKLHQLVSFVILFVLQRFIGPFQKNQMASCQSCPTFPPIIIEVKNKPLQ